MITIDDILETLKKGITRKYLRQTKTSNVFTAVAETDFTLRGGELAEVTGRSGSGKSTLLNMLAGLLKPTEGHIFVDGEDIYSMDDGKRSRFRNLNMGVIPQGQTGLQSLTVLENVLLPCRMYGNEVSADYAKGLLERVGIGELASSYPNELSGGELRRMAIARALINRPKILLADEPTGDLDDENTHEVLSLLRETADEGTAVLLVTHEREAAAYADRLYRMNSGTLTEEMKNK